MNQLSNFGKVMQQRALSAIRRRAYELLCDRIAKADREEFHSLKSLNVTEDDLETIASCVFQAHIAETDAEKDKHYAALGSLVADLLEDIGIDDAQLQAEYEAKCT